MKVFCLLLLSCLGFSSVVMAQSGNKLIYAYQVIETSRRIVRDGWFVDFYEHKDQYGTNTENIFVRQGELTCLVPDFAYLDSFGVPREIDILPMSGADGVITNQTDVSDGTEISWQEAKAWHGDYGSPARTGSYVVDAKGLVVRAELKTRGDISYSYDLPQEPQDKMPSCYDMRLPKRTGN